MKNMIWHGQCETKIGDTQVNPLTATPDYNFGTVVLEVRGEGAIAVYIDELREIIQRYDARI